MYIIYRYLSVRMCVYVQCGMVKLGIYQTISIYMCSMPVYPSLVYPPTAEFHGGERNSKTF